MEHNRFYFIVFLLGFIFVMFFWNAQKASSFVLDDSLLSQIDQAAGQQQLGLLRSIKQQVLQDTGNAKWQENIEAVKLSIYRENVLGDAKQELIFLLTLDPKNSLLAVYEKQNQQYKYIAKIPELYSIPRLTFKSLPDQQYKGLYMEEYVDQLIGAFQEGTYIRFYAWDGKTFKLVFETPKEYKAYWNELWEGQGLQEARWRLITQESAISFQGLTQITVAVEEKQWISRQINGVQIPPLDDFTVEKQRKYQEIYRWDPAAFAYIKKTPA